VGGDPVRRGQIFSMDALMTVVLVVMLIGTVSATSENLKEGITSLVGWYERANIANNMLDVLINTPGEPENWTLNPANVEVVGLRSDNSSYTIDYFKLMALNSSIDKIKDKLALLAHNKDFMIKAYISTFVVSIQGRFPQVYIENKTFSNPAGHPPGINFRITSSGNTAFTVSYVEIIRGGTSYVNDQICSLKTGNNIVLQEGDRIKFILAQDVVLTAKRGQYVETYTIPSGALVDIYITGPDTSQFKINFGGGSCPYSFKFTGQGNVVVTVSAYDSNIPTIWGNYTVASALESQEKPAYILAVINGSVVRDPSVINTSMARSPWIEVEKRIATIGRLEYNLLVSPSVSDPMIYGVLANPLPSGAYLEINVPDEAGNMSFVVVSGTETRGLLVYKNASGEDVKAILVHNATINLYSGNITSISLPLSAVFGSPSNGNTVGVWLYSLNGWDRSSVKIEFVPDIKWILRPKMDAVILKLLVWDDS
jgi:hypothetical protein